MTIQGTEETLSIAVSINTKVGDIKNWLMADRGIEPDKLTFIIKHATTHKKMLDTDEIRSRVLVRGIKKWTREHMEYPHPHCIVGSGHCGLRSCLSYLKEDIKDFVCYDRLAKVGGVAWVVNANPTSKLQTELGVYHLQYDKDYPIPRATMKTWPTREDLLTHFHDVCVEYGIMPHLQLSTDVTEIRVVINDKDLPYWNPKKQHFDLVSQKTNTKSGEETEVTFSTIAAYPGALTCPLRVEYKGEDIFDGPIGYGMSSEFDYTTVKGNNAAVMGFGAFAVENVRTCLECGAAKAYLIVRRKNIAMPRVCSWFINQSLFPPTGAQIMEMMTPMYDMIPDDPWTYYGVMSNKDRTTCTIRQKSRFGIGDLYFLACYMKVAEVIVDSIKRLKPHQILLEGGGKVDVDAIIKVFGYKPDNVVDKLYGIKEMVGFFANGDWRRWIVTEFPGVDAGKFGGTSLSPGAIQNSEYMSYFINFPKDLGPIFDSQMLPKHKPNKDTGYPAYVWEPRLGSSVSMVYSGGLIPALVKMANDYGPLNRAKQLEAHPLEQFVDECAAEWDNYAKEFKARGSPVDPPPYPLSHEFVRELVERNDREGEEDAAKQAARMAGSEPALFPGLPRWRLHSPEGPDLVMTALAFRGLERPRR
eukprot:CAMPEP_0197901342 /NCGR_PEP_ID=MMETSP1439-20131203/50952_1 /TAXON_ID=66791 /ORGANISM="Gonyaulax spinifera, Strain CCMP409" /LENGTH=641 /DNA_ID=CAMNT_0043522307 /DNA_START=77 /DNA_END=1999 /DNA_ORIENTATION=+